MNCGLHMNVAKNLCPYHYYNRVSQLHNTPDMQNFLSELGGHNLFLKINWRSDIGRNS